MTVFREGYETDAERISPKLWLGSQPTMGDRMAKTFSLLVLCAAEFQPPAHAFPGVTIARPAINDGVPTKDEIRRVKAAGRLISDTILAGRRVLVTCSMGINRSPLVTAFALHRLYDWSGVKTIKHLRAKRHVAGWKILCNPDFERIVARLGRHT